MPRHWYIKTKRGPRGPVTSKALLRLAIQGTLKPNSSVSSDGKFWFDARHVEGLVFQKAISKRWHVRTKRGDAGPFTLPKLRQLAEQGRVGPEYAISSDGINWIKAKRLLEPGFFKSSIGDETTNQPPEVQPQDAPSDPGRG